MYYIWWLDQSECESIEESEETKLPEYIQKEFRSRCGRAGRGRLWSSDKFENIGVDPWPDTILSRYLSKDSGGIVFLPEDLQYVKDLPGTITDLKLNRV